MHSEPEHTPATAADAPSHSPDPSSQQLSDSAPAAAAAAPLAGVNVRIDPETIDADGYVSLWNVAAATMKGNQELTRLLASKLLGFLCKHKCDFVFAS